MMNYEQSLDIAMNNRHECYAMVGGLYVASVSLVNDRVSLTKDYRNAMDLCGLEQIEWLVNNMKDVKFFKIQVQAQSVPITVEEMLGQ
ncbi:hypothetical protein 035JT004_289 [Bacillus phage 035JT004]|nr:hypothetical protein 035JT004_19 [Bacillus phage 035JT004]QZA69777.1 hypothetical protein 035JT004_289 [Bacillus phage 035JT004]